MAGKIWFFFSSLIRAFKEGLFLYVVIVDLLKTVLH